MSRHSTSDTTEVSRPEKDIYFQTYLNGSFLTHIKQKVRLLWAPTGKFWVRQPHKFTTGQNSHSTSSGTKLSQIRFCSSVILNFLCTRKWNCCLQYNLLKLPLVCTLSAICACFCMDKLTCENIGNANMHM